MPARERRRPSGLPSFATGFKPAFKKAWVDRLKMSFTEGGGIEMSDVNLMQHLREVSDRTGPFLKPRMNRDTGAITVKVETGWLFGGQLVIRPRAGARGSWSVRLALDLNVTRFVQTHGFVNWSYRGARSGWAILRSDGEHSVRAEHESLSGTDNLISSDNVRDAIAADWSDITYEYVSLVLHCLDRSINQKTPTNPNSDQVVDLTSWEQWSVQQAEIYWEARGRDAVSAVMGIGDNARTIAHGLDYREYNDSDIVVRTERNSPSLNLKIGNGIRAGVYAKTLERIRYEIRYDAKVRSSAHVPTGKASGDDLTNLSEFVDYLIEDACERLSLILPELHLRGKVGFNERSALVRVLTAISVACGNNHHMAYQLITLLSNIEGVSVKKGDVLFPAVDYLHETKTLRHVRTKKREDVQRYRLSEPLRSAFRRLSENRQQ